MLKNHANPLLKNDPTELPLCRDSLPNLLDAIESIIQSRSIECIWRVLTERLAGIGFTRIVYGFTRYKTEQSFGDPEDLMILSNADECYVEDFIRLGHYRNGPMVRWATQNTGAQSWRQMAQDFAAGRLNDLERAAVIFNKEHGITVGYTISFYESSSRLKGAIGLVAEPDVDQREVDALWADCGREISILCNVAHLKLTRMPFQGARRPLTDRQREVLGWVGDGKTTQDIAVILGLTPATVEKHLRLARQALDVETTAQAVLKAAYQNQIFPVSEQVPATA